MSSNSEDLKPCSNKADIMAIVMVLAICAFPILGALAPRALSVFPAVLGVFGYATHYFIYKSRPAISRPALLMAIPIYALALISCIWSLDPNESLERCLKMLPIFIGGILLFSLVRAQNERFYSLFPAAFMVGLIVAGSINVFESFSSGLLYNLLRGEGYKYTENLSHLNRNVVVFTLCLFPAFMVMMQKKQYIWLGALIVLTGLIFAQTDSQSAHLAFLVGIIMLAFFPIRQKLACQCLLAIVAALLLSTPWLVQYMFGSIPPLINDVHWFSTSYAPQRIEIWDFIARYALQNPLYGFGIESTKMVEEFDSQMLYYDKPVILHPHNFAVQFWMEFGVIGPLLLTALFAYLFRQLSELPEPAMRLSLASLMAFVSTAATGYGFWQGWFLGAIIMVAVNSAVFSHILAMSQKAKT